MEAVNTPLFGLVITIAAYFVSMRLYVRFQWLHPLISASCLLILFLAITGIPYDQYRLGGDMLSFLLGPATVALAVPLYKHYALMRKQLGMILSGVIIGCLAGIISAAGIVLLFGGSRELMLTMIPKTVTTPIAIEIVQTMGGVPELGAVLTVLTGLIGSVIGPRLMELCGIRSDMAIGVAMGTSSHGIGTAKLFHESSLQASVSGFAMGLAGISLSLLMIPLRYFL
ncbi:LrgB family protein [Brevibacillus ginsengisoli]|uniref:LrgB family protein n=1 Tax=Brevibacillus ginsengisoli TaxID=363854 RepID=UPI003CF2792F